MSTPNDALSDGSFLIYGVTSDKRQFRPSDWAERICGVMSSFRPAGHSATAHLSYSPFVVPAVMSGESIGVGGDVKCVKVDGALMELESMAYKFMVNFAKDNDLLIIGTPIGDSKSKSL